MKYKTARPVDIWKGQYGVDPVFYSIEIDFEPITFKDEKERDHAYEMLLGTGLFKEED